MWLTSVIVGIVPVRAADECTSGKCPPSSMQVSCPAPIATTGFRGLSSLDYNFAAGLTVLEGDAASLSDIDCHKRPMLISDVRTVVAQ